MGPARVPVITDPAHAAREPQLAVLSAAAHGNGIPEVAVAIAQAAYAGVLSLPEEQRALYSNLIEAALGKAARRMFEMLPQGQQLLSENARRVYAEGEIKGKIEGKIELILRALDRRGLVVSEAQRDRIRACTDLDTLDGWFDKALSAGSTDDLFV